MSSRPFEGFKFWRFEPATLDKWELDNEPEGFRSERLHELVDGLDGDERHMVERTVFGGVSRTLAGSEIGLDQAGSVRVLNRALEVLREILQEEDFLGSL